MSSNFWHQTSQPLFMLAPMEDVTDTVFREVVLKNSSPNLLHILFTEFTSTDGMCHPKGFQNVRHRLKVNASEHHLLKEKDVKLVAQIWGNNPEKYYKTIKLMEEFEYPFDGIDINMGCPVRNVVAHGSCSALIDQPALASEIIAASREATSLPLSVKTRIGVKNVETERWISHLLQQPIDAIIVHGRIQKQMSDGLADWDEIAKAARLRDEINPAIKIIGNGDIDTIAEAQLKVKLNGLDGAMIGRGIFKNPWLFSGKDTFNIDEAQRIELLKYHLNLFDSTWSNQKNFAILRRFFKIYLSGFKGASELRHSMMQTHTKEEVLEILKTVVIN